MNQHTIGKAISVSGTGLHTGKSVTITFHPAPEHHGFKFKRVDLDNQPVLPADVSRVVSTNRGTTIKVAEAQISTVEHVLSALIGAGLDNVLIEIDGPEAPIMDGSAKPFLQAVQQAGIVAQEAEREYLEITEPIQYRDEVTGTELLALPADDFEITTMIDFNSPALGQQYAKLKSLDRYEEEIAPCRTFVFLREIEQLLGQGLIQGGDLDNAIVIADRDMEQAELDHLAGKLGKPSMKVKEGVLNTTQLHFGNEPARHKLLDVIGDLALIGAHIKGKIVATKPGHTANVEFGKMLKAHMREQRKLRGIPKYDPTAKPVMDNIEVAKWLPHRHPFLFVDKITELSDKHVVGVKNVTFNEWFFPGHFPDNPVFPGVIQIETMAQIGGILALSTVPDPGNWDTYFLKIDNAKFKHMVRPGDTFVVKLELTSPIRRGIVQMQAYAYVGNKLACEAELMAQIVNRNK